MFNFSQTISDFIVLEHHNIFTNESITTECL